MYGKILKSNAASSPWNTIIDQKITNQGDESSDSYLLINFILQGIILNSFLKKRVFALFRICISLCARSSFILAPSVPLAIQRNHFLFSIHETSVKILFGKIPKTNNHVCFEMSRSVWDNWERWAIFNSLLVSVQERFGFEDEAGSYKLGLGDFSRGCEEFCRRRKGFFIDVRDSDDLPLLWPARKGLCNYGPLPQFMLDDLEEMTVYISSSKNELIHASVQRPPLIPFTWMINYQTILDHLVSLHATSLLYGWR